MFLTPNFFKTFFSTTFIHKFCSQFLFPTHVYNSCSQLNSWKLLLFTMQVHNLILVNKFSQLMFITQLLFTIFAPNFYSLFCLKYLFTTLVCKKLVTTLVHNFVHNFVHNNSSKSCSQILLVTCFKAFVHSSCFQLCSQFLLKTFAHSSCSKLLFTTIFKSSF